MKEEEIKRFMKILKSYQFDCRPEGDYHLTEHIIATLKEWEKKEKHSGDDVEILWEKEYVPGAKQKNMSEENYVDYISSYYDYIYEIEKDRDMLLKFEGETK